MCPHCGYEDGDEPDEALHLEPGRLLKDTYIVGKVLGYGGFGVTYLAWNTVLEQKVAIKEYLPSEFSTRMPGQTKVTVFHGDKSEQFNDGVDKFVEEANRLAQFRNTDGIVRIFESFKENNTAYIVMEYLDGETLTKYLEKTGPLPADEAVRLMTPLIQSLQVVHEQNIIHRDIAPDNIMVTRYGQVKLIDFGAARYATTSHSRSLTVVIKPGYSPEEQYRSRGDQGPWTDVYAVGSTMYRMITGQTPPDAMERRAFFEGKKKDILAPLTKYSKKINLNQETAILNAMNVRIEDRTPDMAAFEQELNSVDEVKRRYGKIKKIDVLKWPLWTKIAIPAAACLVLTLSVLFATGIVGFNANLRETAVVPDGMTKVPSVISNDVEKAETRTKEAILILKITDKKESDDIPINLILSQDLGAGSLVTINTEIKVVISAGKAKTDEELAQKDENGQLSIADVQYRTKGDAIALLEKQGLIVQIEEQSSETVEAGVIISQNPPAGTPVDPGSGVTIVVSTGGAVFDVPNVIGKSEVAAKTELSGKGLSAKVEYAKNDGVPVGNVISQSPGAGSKASKGDAVTIVVSSGKPLVSVPNVVGQQKNAAGNDLKKLGLEVAVSEAVSGRPKDEIISQTPQGGASLEKGGIVSITVSKGQCTVSLNANGGSVLSSSIQANVGGTITGSLPTPIRENYSFVGWFTAASGDNQVTSSTTFDGNTTIYAQWTQNQYTVTFNPNGGNVNPTTQVYPGGQGLNAPVPTRTYHTFNGWFTAASGGSKVENGTAVNANMTLYAQWTRTKYTVTFNPNGGNVSPTSFEINAGDAIGALPTPTRDYYNFTGWLNGSSQINASFVVTGNITLVAMWSQKALSDWILASSVPAGAQIVNRKWTYTHTQSISDSNAPSGYAYVSTAYGSWSGWSAWQNSSISQTADPRNSGQLLREVRTQNIAATYKTQYHYYHWTNSSHTGWYSYKNGVYNILEEKWFDYQLSLINGYYRDGGEIWIRADYENNRDVDKTFTRQVQVTAAYTQWSSRTRTATYTYKKDNIETATSPSGAGISNIQEYVQYRPK